MWFYNITTDCGAKTITEIEIIKARTKQENCRNQ